MADEEKKEEKIEEAKEEMATEKTEESKEEIKKEDKKEIEEKPKKEEKKAAPSGKFADLISQIEEMPVAELADLVKALEERFGVSASAPTMMAGGAPASGTSAEVEEKSSYTVMLKDAGAQKIAVIKAVREVNQNLGLVEAKNLVDSAPKEISKDISKEEAEEAKKKLEAAGATVELV